MLNYNRFPDFVGIIPNLLKYRTNEITPIHTDAKTSQYQNIGNDSQSFLTNYIFQS